MGGNLVAVQASRISTSLHMISSPGKQPPNNSYLWQGLCGTFWSSKYNNPFKLIIKCYDYKVVMPELPLYW